MIKVFAACLLVLSVGCGRPKPQSIADAWVAADAANLKPSTKSSYGIKRRTMLAILESRPAAELQAELARIEVGKPSSVGPEFDEVFIEAMVMFLADAKEKEALAALLCKHCPHSVGAAAIEYYLAASMPDGIDVLAMCYDNAANPTVKTNALEAFSRAFPALRKKGLDGPEFIRSCQEWCLQNKGKVKLHPYYAGNASMPYWPGRETNLFVPLDFEPFRAEQNAAHIFQKPRAVSENGER